MPLFPWTPFGIGVVHWAQTPAQARIKIPPGPVWQSPEQAATGRHAHEGEAPHPAGKGKQRWENRLPRTVTPQYVVAGSQSAHAASTVPAAPPPPPAPPHTPV